MKHKFYKRKDELAHCEICNGAEASLPKECPGKKMLEQIKDAVQSQLIDYYDGSWWWIDNRYKLTEKELLCQLHYDNCAECDLAGPPDYCTIYRQIRDSNE